jgi:hypothetical protein
VLTVGGRDLRVRQRSERTDRLLAGVAERLQLERLVPTDRGLAPIRLMDPDMSPAECWNHVRDALDATDPAGDELVTIGQGPER